jgi:hypothetical protein
MWWRIHVKYGTQRPLPELLYLGMSFCEVVLVHILVVQIMLSWDSMIEVETGSA